MIFQVYYNSINVLKRAKDRTRDATSVNVEWDCSSEFLADINSPISFVEEDSYAMIGKQELTPNEV